MCEKQDRKLKTTTAKNATTFFADAETTGWTNMFLNRISRNI